MQYHKQMQRNSCTIDFILKSLLNQTNQTHVYFWGHASQRVQSIIMQSNRIKSDITKKSLFFNTYMHCFRRFTYSYLFIIIFFKENNSKTVWKLEERNSSFGQFCNDLEKVCEKVFLRFPLYPSRCSFALCSCNLVEINCKGPQRTSRRK